MLMLMLLLIGLNDTGSLLMDNKDLSINCWSSIKKSGHSTVEDKGIRIIHLPTGTIVECDSKRSQHQNRAVALEKLSALLEASEGNDG